MTTALADAPVVDLSRRDIRQRGLVPPERLATAQALVIGVGAGGRQVALQLASMGVNEMILMDDDVVSVENLANQGYYQDDLGLLKVDAMAADVLKRNPAIKLRLYPERFRRSTVRKMGLNPDVFVFSCVDDIDTRGLIWDEIAGPRDDYYKTTLFPKREAFVGGCTAQSSLPIASIAAGYSVWQMARWMQNDAVPLYADMLFNIQTMDPPMLDGPPIEKGPGGLFIDGRMQGEVIRILTAAL